MATAFGEGTVFKHGIKAEGSEKTKIKAVYLDLTEYNYTRTDVEHIPGMRKVILGIDLDYFACTCLINNRMSYDLAITADQYVNRDKFLEDNKILHL